MERDDVLKLSTGSVWRSLQLHLIPNCRRKTKANGGVGESFCSAQSVKSDFITVKGGRAIF